MYFLTHRIWCTENCFKITPTKFDLSLHQSFPERKKSPFKCTSVFIFTVSYVQRKKWNPKLGGGGKNAFLCFVDWQLRSTQVAIKICVTHLLTLYSRPNICILDHTRNKELIMFIYKARFLLHFRKLSYTIFASMSIGFVYCLGYITLMLI